VLPSLSLSSSNAGWRGLAAPAAVVVAQWCVGCSVGGPKGACCASDCGSGAVTPGDKQPSGKHLMFQGLVQLAAEHLLGYISSHPPAMNRDGDQSVVAAAGTRAETGGGAGAATPSPATAEVVHACCLILCLSQGLCLDACPSSLTCKFPCCTAAAAAAEQVCCCGPGGFQRLQQLGRRGARLRPAQHTQRTQRRAGVEMGTWGKIGG